MFEKRTDLALEIHELKGEDSGITAKERFIDGIKVTEAEILNGEGEKLSGKHAGRYITLEIGKIWNVEKSRFNRIAEILAEEISKLVPEGDGCVLIAGLGNEAITPDSLGPKTVGKLLITRHIKEIDNSLFESAGFGYTAAISPGVLGQTGIESADIIKCICENINPKCVIIIDSLASRRLARLATTVQLSDSGISPGSGVSNHRHELNRELLGTPVVSIGIPTVVDAATLAHDLLEEQGGISDERFEEITEKLLAGSGKTLFITPKDSDIISEKTAKLLADAINIAIHKMSINEINEFIG